MKVADWNNWQERACQCMTFSFVVNQAKLHRGWDVSRAKEMWHELGIVENFGDWEGPPYAKQRLLIPTWVLFTSTKEVVKTKYKDARISEHSKSVSGLCHVFCCQEFVPFVNC